jgi:hypothetical protein
MSHTVDIDALLAEAEQRGRLAELRETVEAHGETFGIACSTSRMWLRERLRERVGNPS